MNDYLIIFNSLLPDVIIFFIVECNKKLWPVATTNHIQPLAKRVLARKTSKRLNILILDFMLIKLNALVLKFCIIFLIS